MDNNLKIILEEFGQYKGQFVMTDWGWKVERLIAIGEDEMDYYYVTYDGRKLTWHSCVGMYIPLKGQLSEKDYQRIAGNAKRNHDDYLVREHQPGYLEEYIEKLTVRTGKHDKYLTKIAIEII